MIENQARYEAAKEARIRNNARIGKERRWKASNADAQRVSDFLRGAGEFASIEYTDAYGDQRWNMHPLRKAVYGEFFAKMESTLEEWGALTDKQTATVVAMIERAEARIAERKAQQAHQQATCEHVGTVGERITIEGTIFFRTSFDGTFGTTYITGVRDAAGNIFIQKGAPLKKMVTYKNQWGDDVTGEHYLDKGDDVRIKATVKEHGVRDGVKQTIISRPKHI